MSRLTEFYRGTGRDTKGRTLAELWVYSDQEMEWIHDFIQWLFPLRAPSQFNSHAPLLTDDDIDAFRNDPVLQENMRKSVERFLAFLGLNSENGHVVPGPDFDRKRVVFQDPNHNWLRITRVLTSTRMLGLEDASRALFDFLRRYRESNASGITVDTFRFWESAAS